MNEVESYLRQSGDWGANVCTDSRGHAIPSRYGVGRPWWPTYYAQWLNAHGATRQEKGLDPGGWTQDDKGRDWWTTTTPEWDRQWFLDRSVRPPERFGDRSQTHWEDCGDGLSKLTFSGSEPRRFSWKNPFRGKREVQ